MESIETTEDDAYSWRDVLMTVALATAVLVLFLRRRETSPSATAPSSSSEEERRRRRERLAAVAEERAAAARMRSFEGAGGGVEKCDARGEKSMPAKDRPDSLPDDDVRTRDAKETCEVTINNFTCGNDTEVVDGKLDNEEKEERGQPAFDSDAGVAGKRKANSGDDVSDDDKVGSEVNGDADATINEAGAIIRAVDTGADVAGKGSAKNRVDAGDDGNVDSEANDDADVSRTLEAGTMRPGLKDDGKPANGDEVHFESSTADDERKIAVDDAGHRERHAQAIAKIVAKRGNPPPRETPPSVPSLTIHLIMASSPTSSRIELSIPTDVTVPSLLRRASQASGVPEAELKLIFRGRIIAERGQTHCAVKEFGIEDGSALHVVGKPRPRKENDDGGDTEGEGNMISRREGISGSGEEGDGVTGEENDSAVEVTPLSHTWERAQIMADIRNSTGEGPFHRAAQRGDLDALREAVDNGFSDLLHVADSNGWTPLHEAVRAGHVHVVEYLVEEVELDIDEVTNQGAGWSAMSLALEHHGANHPVTIMVRTLLERSGVSSNPWRDSEEEMHD